MRLNLDFMLETFVDVWRGVPTSFAILLVSCIIGLPLGFLIAIARYKRVKVVSQICAFIVSFIRGTPMVVQIYVCYSVLPTLLNIYFKNNNIDFNVFDIPPILYAFFVFILSTMALSSEVFRSALIGVDKGQMEAARATGLTSFQAYRRIIIPQALVSALPNLCNLVVNSFKGTSLVFIMGVQDITAIARTGAGMTFCYIEAYLDIFLVYLVLCFIIDYLFRFAERSLKKYKALKV